MATTTVAPPVVVHLRRAREVLLTSLAVLGALCLLLTAAGALTGASLVVFRTGSMSPTMPVGAVAVVRPVAAADVAPGDVVTVVRPGSPLPVTHRVVATAPRPGHPDGAVLTLRGDANGSADPLPYEVDEVRLVVLAVPHAGGWLEAVRTPRTMLLATALAAAGVAWSSWPRRAPGGRRHRA
ncbi:signal peptidase I [Aquipuribacter hungaricus]|uniref:signal peptidase I n=1 Tax=Aquipuribacter hungaricus TaxID=545624 RepID=UPI00361DF39B